ncbi:MAG TPA: iron ABC transporter permease, partial [Burkholderiaceae bacterium]
MRTPDQQRRWRLASRLATWSLVLVVAGLAAGSDGWSVRALCDTLLGGDAALIVGEIRAPRTLGAWLAGALLGLSG